MGNDGEDLGPPVAWQIREMPERLRDALTEQARMAGVKVGEFLTRLVLDARDNGWSFQPGPKPAPVAAVSMMELIRTTVEWSKADHAGLPRGLVTEAERLLRAEMRAARGVAPRRRSAPTPRLGAPAANPD